MSFEELTRRLEEADRRRLALRRSTLELLALGRNLFHQSGQNDSDVNRSERSHRRTSY